MELFYSSDIDGRIITLDKEESCHCVRVLRHREGDEICITDGEGTLYRARIVSAAPAEVKAETTAEEKDFGVHPYRLTMAVCPTKNADRFEWFVEKAVETGVDRIVPVIGDRSERKIIRTDRIKRLALSAAKQSLKGRIPVIEESQSVRDFICRTDDSGLKLVCYCFEGNKLSIKEALSTLTENGSVSVLVGPEGDFSPEEVALALKRGFIPVHLGESRLRTETAALTCVSAVYLETMK